MNETQSKEVVLKVNDLKQHFITGSGKYRIYNKAVDGVSFEICRGEVFSLVGESGCGKTTTGRTIMRLYQPTDGEVYLLGKRIVAGTASLKKGIKAQRKALASKRKELKAQSISKEEFDAFASESAKNIEKAKEDIKQCKKDQFNRYYPSKEQIEQDKIIAAENIKKLNAEILSFEAELKSFKQDVFTEYDNLQSTVSGSEKDRMHSEALKKYREKRKDIREKISHNKVEINKNITASKGASKSLLKKLQMIFQDPIDSLDPRMTVKDIIAEGLYINGIKNDKIVSEKVYESLKLVGLMPEHASHYPHEFSGGQRQRVGIARAIACDPEVIIADEPISALDVSIQAQVINLLNDLKEELGLTILFIAHDLSVVKHFSDKVAVMYFGHIVEMGDKQKVFDHPLHPYTKSLISSIPQPNPKYERLRDGLSKYDPTSHNYTEDTVITLREIEPGHMVLCSDKEFEDYKKQVNE